MPTAIQLTAMHTQSCSSCTIQPSFAVEGEEMKNSFKSQCYGHCLDPEGRKQSPKLVFETGPREERS